MLTDNFACRCHHGSGHQGRRVGGQTALQHREIITGGHETDVHRFFLVGGDEAEFAGDGARLLLGVAADRCEHAPHDRSVDTPEEVALVLVRVPPAEEMSVPRHHVVSGGDVVTLERVGVGQQVAELRERVASHAGNRRSPTRVLGDEILDDVLVEPVLEVEHIVRDAESLCD